MKTDLKTFDDALERLGILDYKDRIWNSNSRGELFHLQDYFYMARCSGLGGSFREWFEIIIKDAEDNWDRPESIFQHMGTIYDDHLDRYVKNTVDASREA